MILIDWTDEQLDAAGIDKPRLKRLVKLLRRASAEMGSMGLYVYGNGAGNLVHKSRPTHVDCPGPRDMKADQGSVVARVGEGFDGGDW